MPCGAARGGSCESDPGGQGSCREIEGRLHTSKGDPQRTLGGVSVQPPTSAAFRASTALGSGVCLGSDPRSALC